MSPRHFLSSPLLVLGSLCHTALVGFLVLAAWLASAGSGVRAGWGLPWWPGSVARPMSWLSTPSCCLQKGSHQSPVSTCFLELG